MLSGEDNSQKTVKTKKKCSRLFHEKREKKRCVPSKILRKCDAECDASKSKSFIWR